MANNRPLKNSSVLARLLINLSHETANAPLIPVKIKFDSIQCNSTVPMVKMFLYFEQACPQRFTSAFDNFMNKYKDY